MNYLHFGALYVIGSDATDRDTCARTTWDASIHAGGGHRPVGDTHGTDDEPTGGRADEVKRITRDQCQRPCGRRVEHRDVFRVDHPGSLDAIDVPPLDPVHLNHVTGRGIL